MTTTATTCPTCDLGLHHCHGLVAVHDDGTARCLDGCGGPLAVHDDVVDCVELGLGCCLAVPDARIEAPARPAAAGATAPRAA